MKDFDSIIEPFIPKEPAPCPFCRGTNFQNGIIHITCSACKLIMEPIDYIIETDEDIKEASKETIKNWNSYLKHDLSFLLWVLKKLKARYMFNEDYFYYEEGISLIAVPLDVKTEVEAVHSAIVEIGNREGKCWRFRLKNNCFPTKNNCCKISTG